MKYWGCRSLAIWVSKNGLLVDRIYRKEQLYSSKREIVLSKYLGYLNPQVLWFMLSTLTKYTTFDRRFKSFYATESYFFFPAEILCSPIQTKIVHPPGEAMRSTSKDKRHRMPLHTRLSQVLLKCFHWVVITC